MQRIKVLATVNAVGLKAGQSAELDWTKKVDDLLRAGLLLALKPKG